MRLQHLQFFTLLYILASVNIVPFVPRSIINSLSIKGNASVCDAHAHKFSGSNVFFYSILNMFEEVQTDFIEGEAFTLKRKFEQSESTVDQVHLIFFILPFVHYRVVLRD